ncbi:MAG: hypothetical protein ABR552_03985 [Actinomycetota bacterium]
MQRYVFPLAAGERWSVGDARCKEGGRSPIGTAGGTSVVLGRDTVRVGPVAVQTFIIQPKAHGSTSSGEYDIVEKTWYSPRYHLVIKREDTTTVPGASSLQVQTLLSVRPQ